MATYIINGQVTVMPDRNMVNEVKLEPRLMKLLCLLVNNNGKTVTREHIIKEIWNDYGGADEGLNQAISFLRKILGDANKQIIETIPKVGYVLNAEIKEIETTVDSEPATTANGVNRRKWKLVLLTSALIIFIVVLFLLSRESKNYTPVAPPADSSSSPQLAPVAE